MTTYAIISIGGKQYRVREGQRLLVDRLRAAEGETVTPKVLLGGDGVTVTARVLGERLGEKVRIGKLRRRTGYRRRAGFRAKLTQIEIESIGAPSAKRVAKPKAEATSNAEAAPVTEAAPAAEARAPEAPAERAPVAQVKEGAATWNAPMLAAALEYERTHANRKGAIAALEAAIAAKEESS
jgi:large subunit ribosomal protein L21